MFSGILLYFMITATMPFNAGSVALLKNLILDGNFTIPSFVSVEASTLLQNILKKKPKQRSSLSDILKSVWIKNETGSWIEGEAGYRSCPRLGSDSLSSAEQTTFDELQQMGITEKILRQAVMGWRFKMNVKS